MKVNKKAIWAVLLGFGAAAILAAIILTVVLTDRTRLAFKAQFFYVCYDSPSDATSASSISSVVKSYGGAGYIIRSEGRYYVTVSCYYKEGDAQSVVETLSQKGLECSVVKVNADGYSLKRADKALADKYLGNLNTLASLSVMCYDLANSLDSCACGQDSAKAVLADVGASLNGLLRNNADNCFTEEIEMLCAECEDAIFGYVFSYDVRRVQIAITDAIANVKLA